MGNNNEELRRLAALIGSEILAWIARKGDEGNSTNSHQDAEYNFNPRFGLYSTQNEDYAKKLDEILAFLENYTTRAKVSRPINLLLAASPGTGKSFLAKQLAAEIERRTKGSPHGQEGVEFEEVHVASFRSPDDLLGVFQRVQSANLRGRLPFVLFDEVDGKVGGSYLLANFLAPMWDGKFYDGRESYALGPAIFCFAGSNLLPSPKINKQPDKSEPLAEKATTDYKTFVTDWGSEVEKHLAAKKNGSDSAIPKLVDFIDRIDESICIPPTDSRILGKECAIREYTDLAFSWIIKHFPHIHRIEIAALGVLCKELPNPDKSRRSVEKQVFASCLPASEQKFQLKHLPRSLQSRYSNDQEIQNEVGVFFSVQKK